MKTINFPSFRDSPNQITSITNEIGNCMHSSTPIQRIFRRSFSTSPHAATAFSFSVSVYFVVVLSARFIAPL